MLKKIFLFFFLLIFQSSVHSQKYTAFIKAHGVEGLNKSLAMGGIEAGHRRIVFDIDAGFGKGKDDESISASELSDQKKLEHINASLTFDPEPVPANSHIESCNTFYKTIQGRIGFTVYLRRNDTLGRHPFTGPHIGAQFVFANTIEMQDVIYRSDDELTAYSFSQTNNLTEIGAATHIGWQFAFFKEHLYFDLRAVIPFYYPFTSLPNVNSPFVGNKWEAQASIGWHFYRAAKTKEEKTKDGGTGKVRGGI
ncbi:MAG: hypothetical protein HY064_11955 [Bacteroidetes bacterium]|nr:hypothetical protein [Bacteroidota bacterium]